MILTARKRSLEQGNVFTDLCPQGGERGVCGEKVDPKIQRQTLAHGPRGTPPAPVETDTEAGGTHPTGMHSCFKTKKLVLH